MVYVLSKLKRSVGLMAGGIAEIFLSSTHKEIIYIKKRTGFVKLALQQGTPLIPVYYFGNTQVRRSVSCYYAPSFDTFSSSSSFLSTDLDGLNSTVV
jgi:hypothetical protein